MSSQIVFLISRSTLTNGPKSRDHLSRFEDARALEMALDMPEYFVVRLTLDMAGGIRQGELALVLPKSAPINALDAKPETEESDTSHLQMCDVVMGLPTELNMVLCKVKLELAQVKQLNVGEALHLPHNTFPETDIVTETGKIIGSGVLGQVNGIRALRLKRVPVHAMQPRRREADLADLDLPEITALPRSENAETKTPNDTDVETFVVDSGADLPALKDAKEADDDLKRLGTTSSELEGSQSEDMMLPELDDFPDLADITQISQSS